MTNSSPAAHRNRLAHESSPYLLQHAANPVDWYPWGDEAFAEAKRTGKPKSLAPMTPFERKCVHDAVAAAGLYSESEGEEPNRYVVVFPA